MMETPNRQDYDDLVAEILEEAGVASDEEDDTQDETDEDDAPDVQPADTPDVHDEAVDEFVDSVVQEAQLPTGPAPQPEPEPEEEPQSPRRSLADYPDAKYKVITYNDKSDQRAFYLYSVIGRYPLFPVLLLCVEAGLSVWFAFNNHPEAMFTFAGLYFLAFLLADFAFFALRIRNILKRIAKKDEHALDTARVEAAFYDDRVVLIKYGFDITMNYERLEHCGHMGDRMFLYFDNAKALLLHTDGFRGEEAKAVMQMLRRVVEDNKARRKETRTKKNEKNGK